MLSPADLAELSAAHTQYDRLLAERVRLDKLGQIDAAIEVEVRMDRLVQHIQDIQSGRFSVEFTIRPMNPTDPNH